MPTIAGQYIDQICSVEMRRRGLPRGLAHTLYAAAREEAGEPLTYRAAQLLLDACEPGRPIFITCAAGGPPWLPHGETDGPNGGAAIARAVAVATSAVPMFVSTDYQAPPIVASARAAGLVVVEPETALERASWGTTVLPYNEIGDGTESATALIDHYQPTAIVAVETLGPNSAGVIHSITGHPIDDAPAYHSLFDVAASRAIPSVGIGDGGNEIGFGRIVDAVREIQVYGSECQCPCGQGVATTIATDVLVFAAVSNWGAYGVAAMLGLLSGRQEALHDSDTDRRMLEACLAAGAVDGGFANHGYTVDGIDARVSFDLVNTLNVMTRLATEEIDRPF